jgi:large subunit ribosomal protein L35
MPKMKSKKALAKRVKVSGTGKVVRHHAYVSHLAPHKTHKQKRHLRKATVVSASDMKRIKYLIQQ